MAKYYNQNNYPNTPYPSPSNKAATVKSGGCGPTCAAMIVESLTTNSFAPPAAATFAINNGARASTGTNMTVLAKAIAAKFGLTYSTTNDENTLLTHLKAGGMAIANVGGDRAGYVGVFSDGGHYIVVIGAVNNTVSIYDPGYYSGKFNKAGRKGKVTVSGNECKCDISVLKNDTLTRSPKYYLFKKEAAEVITKTKIKLNGTTKTVDAIVKDGNNYIKLQDLRDGKIDIGYDIAQKLPTIAVKQNPS